MRLTEVAFIEPENMNHDATDYLAANYNDICKYASTLIGSPELAQDLVHDVYISLVNAEAIGAGYDDSYEGKVDGANLNIAQYVFGRLRRSSKNIKYQKGYVETKKVDNKKDSENDIYFSVVAASFDGEDIDSASDLQKAYANAPTYDDLDILEERLSLQENMDILFDIASLHKIDLINLFKNIDTIGEMLGNGIKNFSQFDGIRELIKNNDMCGEIIQSVMEFASKDRSYFDAVMATYA